MVLEYGFDKAKLPRGMSFPLKRSVLDAALIESGVTKIHCVYYWLRKGGHNVMRADYCGEGQRGAFAAGLATITVYAVPSSERRPVETCLLAEVLPRIIRWLVELERAGNVRRGVRHEFVAAWRDGVVSVETS